MYAESLVTIVAEDFVVDCEISTVKNGSKFTSKLKFSMPFVAEHPSPNKKGKE